MIFAKVKSYAAASIAFFAVILAAFKLGSRSQEQADELRRKEERITSIKKMQEISNEVENQTDDHLSNTLNTFVRK